MSSSIQQRAIELEGILKTAFSTPFEPKRPPIETGAELHVKGLREIVGEKLKSRRDLEVDESKKAILSLQNKTVCIYYMGLNGTEEEDVVTLETTHWLMAAIMNLFAKIFPKYVQGAAKFSIDNQTCYVRRALIQEKLHIPIERHEFRYEPEKNAVLLKVLSLVHFESEDISAQTSN